MAHNIKIQGTADFSSITKEVRKISDLIDKSFGDSGVQVLDTDSINFVRTQSQQLFSQMDKRIDNLRKKMTELDNTAKKNVGTERESVKIARERLKILDEMTSLEQQRAKLSQAREIFDLPPSAKQELQELTRTPRGGALARVATGGLSRIGNALPGVSEAMGVAGAARAGAAAGGASPMGMAAGGLMGGALGLGALGAYRAYQGFEQYKATTPTIMNLEAMGLEGNPSRRLAKQYGFGAQDQLQMQESLSRALGTMTGAKGGNRLENTMLAARNLAVAPEQISMMGNQLRQAGGTEQANKQLAMILDKAVTSGMDKSQAASYLATAAGLLSELNQNGTADSDKLLAVMTDLAASGNMSAEQASRSIQSVQDAIAGSEGEANAFFQAAAAKAGLGGGTLLGTQMAVRQGLQGVDMEALSKQLKGSEIGGQALETIKGAGLGDADFTRKMAGETLDLIKKSSGGNMMAQLGIVGQVFGAKSAPEQAKVLALLEKMAKGTATKEDRKVIEDLAKDPQATWRDEVRNQLATIAGNTSKKEAEKTVAQFELGKESAPIFNALTTSIINLDDTIKKFLMGDFSSIGDSIMDGVKQLPDLLAEGFKFGLSILDELATDIAGGIRGAFAWAWDMLKVLFTEVLPASLPGVLGGSEEKKALALQHFKEISLSDSIKQQTEGLKKANDDAALQREMAEHMAAAVEELRKANKISEAAAKKILLPPNASRGKVTP